MTELELYKYISDNDIEYHWNDKDVYICIYIFQLEEFVDLFKEGYGFFYDGGYEIRLMGDYLSIEMGDICDYHGIDMEKIFKKDTTDKLDNTK